MPVADDPPVTLDVSTAIDEMVGCPVVWLTVNVRGVDHALRLPARSAVRTRQKNVQVQSPPELPTLGGMTADVSGTAPRNRMKFFAKSTLVETWNSYACTPEASATPFHSRRPIRPLWKVAPSAGIVSVGGSVVRSPPASGSS